VTSTRLFQLLSASVANRAPDGAHLRQLRMKRFDPAFAGRWNAGSNARNGGTDVRPDEYIRNVSSAMREAWEL